MPLLCSRLLFKGRYLPVCRTEFPVIRCRPSWAQGSNRVSDTLAVYTAQGRCVPLCHEPSPKLSTIVNPSSSGLSLQNRTAVHEYQIPYCFFQKGNCKNGNPCLFAHTLVEPENQGARRKEVSHQVNSLTMGRLVPLPMLIWL